MLWCFELPFAAAEGQTTMGAYLDDFAEAVHTLAMDDSEHGGCDAPSLTPVDGRKRCGIAGEALLTNLPERGSLMVVVSAERHLLARSLTTNYDDADAWKHLRGTNEAVVVVEVVVLVVVICPERKSASLCHFQRDLSEL